MSIRRPTSAPELDRIGPRVFVKEAFEPVYEAELIDDGERYTVRRLDTGEQKTVRPSQVWINGPEVLPHNE